MKKVMITDLVWFQEGPGVRRNQYTESGVKLLNVSNLVNGEIVLENSSRYISNEEAYGKYNHFLCDEGDLIIASSGIKVEYLDEKMGFVKKEMLPLCMNTSTIRFKSVSDDLNIRYFMYYLKSNLYKNQIQKLITGSAQLNYGPSHLKKVYINLHSNERQGAIVKVLDLLSEIKNTLNKRLNQYNKLVKSQFIEMFGDIFNNNKRWKWEKLKNNIIEMFIGPFGSSLKLSDYVNKDDSYGMVYEQKHAINSNLELDNNYIDIDKYKQLKRFEVFEGDFIMSCRGTIGKIYKIPHGAPRGVIHSSLMKIRINAEKYNHVFFEFLLSNYIEEEQVNGSGVKMAIKASLLKERLFIKPPISLQNRFAKFVELVDKLKFIDLMENLEKYVIMLLNRCEVGVYD